MALPVEVSEQTQGPAEPKWRPVVRTVENLLCEGQPIILMRRYSMVFEAPIIKEGTEGTDDAGEQEETITIDDTATLPERRIVRALFPGLPKRRIFNLSVLEAGHIAAVRAKLAQEQNFT